jgi:hypothetical protein
MQQKLIGTLLVMLNANTTAMPNIDFASMLGLSDSSRVDSVATLARQYQRFSTAAPISNSPSQPSSTAAPISNSPTLDFSFLSAQAFCRGGLTLLGDSDQTFFFDSSWELGTKWACPVCFLELHVTAEQSLGVRINHRFLLAQHINTDYPVSYGCLACSQSTT